MRVLGIDTSGSTVGISIVESGETLIEVIKKAQFRMVEELFTLLVEIENMGFKFDEIEGVGVVKGPGNFTSLRVGIAFAKIFASKNNIPVKGLVSLDLLGYQMRWVERGIALIKAYSGLFYTAEYNYGRLNSKYAVKPLENIGIKDEVGVAGNGIDFIRDREILRFENYIRPSVVGFIAESLIKKGETDHIFFLSPFYLQKIKAEEDL